MAFLPWKWLTARPAKAARLKFRILEGLREVGLLLIAFAPLEAALKGVDSPHPGRFLAKFLGGGMVLFGLALMFEWRSDDLE